MKFDVAAYIWPSYHYEPRAEHFWPEGDGEWYTVRRGKPRFPGHDMPRIPLLGKQDEADPEVMRQHVELAIAHGVNVFIVDWYWYGNAPCFERQLNEGLIPALEGTDCKFYLMWANHDVTNLWDMHNDTDNSKVLWKGGVTREILDPMFERIVKKYFSLNSYYRVNDKPLFSIYEYRTLVAAMGGIEQAAEALSEMRNICSRAGEPGLELQTIAIRARQPWYTDDDIKALGFDSATSYQYCHDSGSSGDYVEWADKAIRKWNDHEKLFGVFYPHVSVGWDNTHRNPSAGLESVVLNATPSAFEACLWRARRWLEARPQQAPLVTINSWNEWTEGSYLLPDMRWGYEYLRAVRNVFV
jgi:hypothetical protein